MKRADGVQSATDGSVACSTLPFRYGERLQLTVIVKATFTIVPLARATHLGPGEVNRCDHEYGGNPTRSIEKANDRAPFRQRCDVTLRGHAHVPVGAPSQTHFIRIGVARGEHTLLDRVLNVLGDPDASGNRLPLSRMALTYENARGGPGTDNPVGSSTASLVDPHDPARPTGVGPLSPFWPTRKRLLGAFDRRGLDQDIPSLPEATPWDYFQTAPREQQIEYLLGGELLVLDGVHPTLTRIQTELPRERPVVRVVVGGPHGQLADMPGRVELRCDTLAIDADLLTFDLCWRGCFQLPDEQSLRNLLVLAALPRQGIAPDWPSIAARARIDSPSPQPFETGSAPRQAAVGESTIAVAPQQAARLARENQTPFVAAPPVVPLSTQATPWADTPLLPSPPVVIGESTLHVGGAGPIGESTHALSNRDHAASVGRALAPYPLARPAHAASDNRLPPWAEAAAAPRAPPAVPGEATLAVGARQAHHPMPPARLDAIEQPQVSTANQPAASGEVRDSAPLAHALRNIGVRSDELAGLLAAISTPKKS